MGPHPLVGRRRAPPGGRSSKSQRRTRPHGCSPRRLRTEGLLRRRKAARSSLRLQFPVRPLASAADLSPRASGSWARVAASAIPGPPAPVQPGWPQGGWVPLRSLCLIRAGAGGVRAPAFPGFDSLGPIAARSGEWGVGLNTAPPVSCSGSSPCTAAHRGGGALERLGHRWLPIPHADFLEARSASPDPSSSPWLRPCLSGAGFSVTPPDPILGGGFTLEWARAEGKEGCLSAPLESSICCRPALQVSALCRGFLEQIPLCLPHRQLWRLAVGWRITASPPGSPKPDCPIPVPLVQLSFWRAQGWGAPNAPALYPTPAPTSAPSRFILNAGPSVSQGRALRRRRGIRRVSSAPSWLVCVSRLYTKHLILAVGLDTSPTPTTRVWFSAGDRQGSSLNLQEVSAVVHSGEGQMPVLSH